MANKRPSVGQLASDSNNKSVSKNKRTASLMFLGAVADISWQLAIVVLVPIIGGFELDKHLSTTPALTIIGFVLAMVGTFVVTRKALIEYSSQMVETPKDKS